MHNNNSGPFCANTEHINKQLLIQPKYNYNVKAMDVTVKKSYATRTKLQHMPFSAQRFEILPLTPRVDATARKLIIFGK